MRRFERDGAQRGETDSNRGGPRARLPPDLVPLYALAAAVMCAAGGWYLLKELAPLLRPLILAVFLAYTILPVHRRLSRRVPAKLAGPLLALLVAVVVLGLAVLALRQPRRAQGRIAPPDRAGPGTDRGRPHLGPRPLARLGLRAGPGRGPGRGGDGRAAQGPRVQPGQRRGRLPGRGPGRRVLPDLPAARSPSLSRAGPGRVRSGTGRPRARGHRVDQPRHGLVPPSQGARPAW